MTLAALLPLLLAAAARAQGDAPLVKVNGAAITRAMVADRAWQKSANAALGELVDEALIVQAAAAVKLSPDQKEVDARLARIRAQFADQETFSGRLAATGTTLEALRAQLGDQVLREQLVIKAKGLKVSDAEAKEFFESNREKLGTPEAWRLRHLLVATEKEANDFLVAIRAGAEFARLAASVSQDASTRERGGDLGFITKGMLQPDIEKVALSLKPGEVSAPIKTELGFHLLKLEEIRPSKPASYKDVQAELKASLLADKVAKAWPGYLQELREKAKVEPVREPAR